MRLIDSLLSRITMYRLVLYDLIAMLLAAAGLSFFNILHFNPFAIGISALYLVAVCWASHRLFARVFQAPANTESSYITGLILALIITPIRSPHDFIFLTAAGGLAVASKYILAIRHKHIFNPAAIAVVLTAFGAKEAASWWIGSAAMLPFITVGGFLVVRKIQREWMVAVFLAVVTVGLVILAVATHGNVATTLKTTLLASPLIYFASIMFTEPLTSPGTLNYQIWFAILVGILILPVVHIRGVYSTPELALIMGNLLAFAIGPNIKRSLKLSQKLKLAPDIMDFVFALDQPIKFQPGQYMEFTLPHSDRDSRGSRRYFTLANSPTENNLRIGVKFYPNGSSYKQALQAVTERTPIAAGSLSGHFTLPGNASKKLAFIAGGIGVTPYRSMIKYLVDKGQRRDVVLLYAEKNRSELVYSDVFEEARQRLGIKPIYVLSDEPATSTDHRVKRGLITAELIQEEVPDFIERTFYVSGSHAMVQAMKRTLLTMGVPRKQIKTDFFPGYA